MSNDTPNTPPDNDELERQVFAETRASTLIPKSPPTSGSETLVPTPEEDAPQVFDEAVIASEASATSSITPALLDEFAATQADQATESEAAAPAPEPIEIETTQPQVSFDAAPQPPADDPALALTFAPAPDAPFQSSVTVGIRGAEGARVFYTTDGTAPDENSTPYSPEKILLTQSATLSARAFSGGKCGPICMADYIVSKPLWQENEPAEQTDPTPHKASENQSAPDAWQMAAASVRGKLHAHRALWREDAFALGNAGEWSVVIVSDGAGSAPLSRVGSNLACQTALADLTQSLGEIETLSDDINADLPRIKAALVGAGVAALAAIRDEADARSQPINAFAATLLILVRRTVGEAQLCAALQVGDGAIALDCESGLKLLGAADHGQHSSETRFLTTQGMEDDFANRVKFSLPRDLRATLVVSDGVSDDYFPEDKRLTEVFEAVIPLAHNADDAGAALLEWLGYEKKGSSDDRTIALSWPSGRGAVGALEAELSEIPGVGLTSSPNRDADTSSDSAAMTSSFDLADNAETRLEEDAPSALENSTEAGSETAELASSANLPLDAETRLEPHASPAPETEIALPDDAATAPGNSELSDGS